MPKKRLTAAQELLRTHLSELGFHCVTEHQFMEDRRFRFDLYCNELSIGFECDGGQWSGGHMRGKALESQYEKDRLAQLRGFRIFRFTNRQILNGEAKSWLAANL
jgi:very-short-patch-repair endonuclease